MPKPDVTVPLRVQDLLDHLSHEVEIVTYGPVIIDPVNVALECVDCSTVLADADL